MNQQGDREPSPIGKRVGAYQIAREIGCGGMGKVYLAYRADGEFRKKVALKVMHPGLDPGNVARFRQERQILADLDHPNIARLLDAGTTVEGLPYLVMEYVRGESLRQMLRAQGHLPLPLMTEILEQVCSGLHAAHLTGVFHRDMKPENIVVERHATGLYVKILDFGIAKLLEPKPDSPQTGTGMLVGTLAYMPPELAAKGASVDHRSDIYSLGMVAYEMLTGQVAFQADSHLSLLLQHLQDPPRPPSQLRPDLAIPPDYERAILKALEKDQAKRCQTALEFARELRLACPRGGAPPPVVAPAPAPPGTDSAPPLSTGRLSQLKAFWAARRVGILATLTAMALLVLAGLILDRLTRTGPDVPPVAAGKPGGGEGGKVIAQPRTLLRFRVVKRGADGGYTPLPVDSPVRTGDEIRFEVKPLQPGRIIFLFEKRDGTLQWWNPASNARALTDQRRAWTPIPEGAFFSFDTNSGEQKYLIIFAPASQEQSFERATTLPNKEEDEPIDLPPVVAEGLRAYIGREAILLTAQKVADENAECQEFSYADGQNRVAYYQFILKQLP